MNACYAEVRSRWLAGVCARESDIQSQQDSEFHTNRYKLRGAVIVPTEYFYFDVELTDCRSNRMSLPCSSG
jgi:hypothetical protein